jgi:glycosyltransferase involved in cell wall biosynthesis
MAEARLSVLLLTGSLSLGGTERNVLHLATRLDKARFDVRVVSDYEGEPVQEQLREAGVPCRALKGAPSLGKPLLVRLFGHNLPYQWRLFRIVRRHRRGIVHAFGFPMAYYAVLLGRLAGCRRLIFTVQDWDIWKKSWRYRWLDKLCSRLAWRVVADGEGARRLAVERQGMAADKTVTIYDGVNTDELATPRSPVEMRRELNLDPGRPVVGVIARLDVAKKGQDVFLAAIGAIHASHPGAQFILVGDGPDRNRIAAMVHDLPREARPVMTGFRSDLADVLKALDILVIPSRWESVPKILLEAMWLQRAIVATRVGDLEEVLDASSGVLIPPDAPGALAEAVCELLADTERRRAVGRRARRVLEEKGLTLATSIRRYETLYEGAP